MDALMDRTRGRPLPSGRLSPRSALVEALVLVIPALVLIGAVSGHRALAAGVLGLVWYNGVYTGLKRKTAWAILPGALVGAVPPALGWLAGGGNLGDPQIRALAFLFFMWQIPHFGLVLLKYGGEYEKAGLPSLQRVFRERQLRRITFHWIMALGVGSLGLGLFGMAPSLWTKGLLLAACAGVIWSGRGLLSKDPVPVGRVSRMVNWYMVAVSLAIALPGGGAY